MAQAQFPEPPDLNLPIDKSMGDGTTSLSFNNYSVSNPHPGYGKDPNILNEYGHSVYPKMLYPNGISQPGVTVNSAAEEAELTKPTTPAWPKPNT